MLKLLSMYLIPLFLLACVYAQDIAESPNSGNDWMCRVTLQNGSTMTGVVLSDRFIEKTVYARIYQECDDIHELNAGIRLWYVKNNPGFVFIPYKEVSRVTKINRLSPEARWRIEQGIRTRIADYKRSVSEEERQQKEAKLKQAGVALTEEEEEELALQKEKFVTEKALERLNRTQVMARLSPAAQAILVEFPPEQGWSTETYEQIKPRILRAKGRSDYRGLPISQRRFYENFEQWTIAIEMYRREELNALEQVKQEIRKEMAKQEEAKKKEDAQGVANPTASEETAHQPRATTSKSTVVDLEDPVQVAIREIMYGKDQKKRVAAIEELTNMGAKAQEAIPALKLAAKDKEASVRQASIRSLAKIKEPAELIIEILIERLELGDVVVRREAAEGLQLYGKQAVHRFSSIAAAATMDDDVRVRFAMVRLLEAMGDKRAIGYLQNRLWDTELNVQVAAISGLCVFMTNVDSIYDNGRDILLKALKENDPKVRVLAAECCKRIAAGITKPENFATLKIDVSGAIANLNDNEAKSYLQDALNIIEQKTKAGSPITPSSQPSPDEGKKSPEEDEYGDEYEDETNA